MEVFWVGLGQVILHNITYTHIYMRDVNVSLFSPSTHFRCFLLLHLQIYASTIIAVLAILSPFSFISFFTTTSCKLCSKLALTPFYRFCTWCFEWRFTYSTISCYYNVINSHSAFNLTILYIWVKLTPLIFWNSALVLVFVFN